MWSKETVEGHYLQRLDCIRVNEDKWYTRSRARWRVLCHNGVAAHQDKTGHQAANNVVCEVCCRSLEERVIRKGTSV